MITKACEVCGGEFRVKPYRATTARFCSQQCGGKWHLANRRMPEAHKFGNTYRVGKRPANAFTSVEVQGENNPRWVEPVEMACSNCGSTFHLKPWLVRQNVTRSGFRYCSETCAKAHMRGANDPRYVGGPKTYRGRGWKAARLLAVDRDGGVCQRCGVHFGKSIPVHHIKPFREFATAEDANHLENLVCYCQSCHMKIEPSSLQLRRPDGAQSQNAGGPSRSR